MQHKASVPQNLGNLPDPRFFDEIAKGINHIEESAGCLDRAARDLYDRQHGQGAEVLRLLAEEESAKALILLDAVRCPRRCQGRRALTLKRFTDHVAKRIYARTVDWNTADFGQLSEYVDGNLDSHYLDGPNRADWIVPNEITTYREAAMYVDYARELSLSSPEYWITPTSLGSGSLPYATPTAVLLLRIMVSLGIATPIGLSVVADVWRTFDIVNATTWSEIEGANYTTIQRLIASGLCREYKQDDARLLVERWTAPMWSLEMKVRDVDLEQLREDRKEILERMKSEAAKRDPALTISRGKVQELSTAFHVWRDEQASTRKRQPRSSTEESESYNRLLILFNKLTRQERSDLLALGWFARDTGESWTDLRKRAETALSVSYGYEIEQGVRWLRGLTKWENPPT